MFQKYVAISAFLKIPKTFVVRVGGWVDGWVDGWMDGWVGGWVACDFSPPSIFLIFEFDNNQLAVTSKMCLKLASAY